ncbi:MAG: TatD family hydrolase [archaeon]
MLIDCHCHLNECSETEKAIERAKKNGVERIISASTDFESNKENLSLSRKFPGIVFPCFGIHPSNLLRMKEKEVADCFEFIKENPGKGVGIGEIGLDFKHAERKEERMLQEKIFLELIELGERKKLPLVVHSRYAGKRVLELLEEGNAERVLLHWFNGSVKEFEEGIKRNYFFSIGPSILSSKEYAEKVKEIPLENLMLETDSPVEFNGEKAEPSWIKEVGEKLAELKEVSMEEIENKTSENAFKFFGLE